MRTVRHIAKFALYATVFINLAIAPLTTTLSYGEEDMHKHHGYIESGHAPADSAGDLGICPVMRGRANKGYSYAYGGKVYYFCCPGCREKFRKDPQKYIARIKEIDLKVYQFGFSPDRLVVKKGDIVKIFATSQDVTHGFYIKEYDIDVTVEKDKVKKIEFIADKEGEFDILCTVYCGKGHRTMKAKLVVEK